MEDWLPAPNEHGVVIVNGSALKNAPDSFKSFINEIGKASAEAQHLKTVITTFTSSLSPDIVFYFVLNAEKDKICGFMKTGCRNLFLWDKIGEQHELSPLCLLDFFVYPEFQRFGYGRKLFDSLLEHENIQAREIAIDRPSYLCLAFMKKHFGLKNYVEQANSYVVYDEFWGNSNVKMNRTPSTPERPKVNKLLSPSRVPSPYRTPNKQPHYNPITWEQCD